ncbi:MAG: glycyl-radical enzyme activating protein [Dehalococcoidia bacterium]|nr:glycyl-radical enzyme activating protein [Dehalococcoidia bacterium]
MNYAASSDKGQLTGCVFNIERFAIRDGPGIRTTVFLKGCPLKCIWCANPESIRPYPQMFCFAHLCASCCRCVQACPNKAISVAADGSPFTDRDLCKNCGTCTDVCPNRAREISGKMMTVDQVLEEVKKDALFYQNSGGGITASGGEPAYQPEFLRELFRRSRQAVIHTCLDTTGFVKTDILKSILEHTDLVLYDLKHMDPQRHRQLTGVDNALILENARMIAVIGKPMIIRVPLVPDHNDSAENLDALASFMKELGLARIDLLPYHSLGRDKYTRLGMVYGLSELKPHSSERVAEIKACLESKGLTVEVG